jgi:hypothetical protein
MRQNKLERLCLQSIFHASLIHTSKTTEWLCFCTWPLSQILEYSSEKWFGLFGIASLHDKTYPPWEFGVLFIIDGVTLKAYSFYTTWWNTLRNSAQDKRMLGSEEWSGSDSFSIANSKWNLLSFSIATLWCCWITKPLNVFSDYCHNRLKIL